MKKSFALIFCLLLAGCTDGDWDHALNVFSTDTQETADGAVPQPVAARPATAAASAEPSNSDFCKAVAAQDATSNGFDQPTQKRVYAQSYAQCVAIYSR
jgi:Tfp pilus assembly protein PilP